MCHLIASDDGHLGTDIKNFQCVLGGLHVAARGNGMRDFLLGQMREQFAGARKRADLLDQPLIGILMRSLDPLCLLSAYLTPGLSNERIHEQPAAHSDLPVNAPDRQLDAGLFECFPPRKHMLVDVVHERSVQIEQQRGLASNGSSVHHLHPHLPSRRLTPRWSPSLDTAVATTSATDERMQRGPIFFPDYGWDRKPACRSYVCRARCSNIAPHYSSLG